MPGIHRCTSRCLRYIAESKKIEDGLLRKMRFFFEDNNIIFFNGKGVIVQRLFPHSDDYVHIYPEENSRIDALGNELKRPKSSYGCFGRNDAHIFVRRDGRETEYFIEYFSLL